MIDIYDSAIRILAATVLGFILGFTRRHKPSGIRTFILLCLGSALFTIISIKAVNPALDNTRILAQIISGVGFLGAGVIWKHADKPSGLTTAAMVWVSAGIGICCGLAFWFEAIISAVVLFIVVESKKYLQEVHLEDE